MCIDQIPPGTIQMDMPRPAHPLQHMAFYPNRELTTHEIDNCMKLTGFNRDNFNALKPLMRFTLMQNLHVYTGQAAPTLWQMQQNASDLIETKATMTVLPPQYPGYDKIYRLYPHGKKVETSIICFAKDKETVTHLVSQLGNHALEPEQGAQTTHAFQGVFMDDMTVFKGSSKGPTLSHEEKLSGYGVFGWLGLATPKLRPFMFFINERLHAACKNVLFDKTVVLSKPTF